MIIVMSNAATEEQIESVIKRIEEKGLEANVSRGTERTVIGAIGDERSLDPELLESLPGVEQALHKRFTLLSLIKLLRVSGIKKIPLSIFKVISWAVSRSKLFQAHVPLKHPNRWKNLRKQLKPLV